MSPEDELFEILRSSVGRNVTFAGAAKKCRQIVSQSGTRHILLPAQTLTNTSLQTGPCTVHQYVLQLCLFHLDFLDGLYKFINYGVCVISDRLAPMVVVNES